MIPSSTTDTIAEGIAGSPSYPYLFKTFEATDVKVKVRLIADGTETELVYLTHYTLTGVGQQGGDVLLIAGFGWMNAADLHADYKIFMYFEPNLKQLSRFRDLGRQAPREIENGLDRLTMHVKGFFQGIGEVARSLKLPSSVHPSEFDPTLPVGFNSAEDNVMAVNAALNGWKILNSASALEAWLEQAYTPTAVETIGAGQAITVGLYRRQHVRIKSDGGEKALSNQPFGSNAALFRDGMEIVVESDDPADFLTLAENAGIYGYEGNGGIEFKYKTVVSFIYNANKQRFFVKSLGAW
jgi:hypothetical protein